MAFAIKPGARIALVLSGVAFGAAAAAAQTPTEIQILDALTPKPVTRSLSTSPAPQSRASTADEAAFLDSLKTQTTRSLSVGERDRLATIAEGKPSIDLDIPFALNSATISAKARPIVDALGSALSRPALREGTFMIAGHTDARGSDELNQRLSERRAASVRHYLIEKFKIPPQSLITAGYGKTHLKFKDRPNAGENRRVQTTNLSEVKSASR